MEFSVTEVFIKDFPEYIVPIYQRNYTWGKDEIDQLLEDIQIVEKEDFYYLGNLIVSKKNGKYEIIDGQQRLTTLYILYKLLGLDVPPESLKFEVREKSNYTLSHLDEEIDKYNENYSEEIINGYKIIKEYIERKNISEKMKGYLARVKLLRIEVPEGTDLNHYFEIMNTRGEQLEAQDIIKARMMGVLGDAGDAKGKQVFSMIWNACSDMNRYVQMKFDIKNRIGIFGGDWNQFIPQTYKNLIEIIKDVSEFDLSSLEYILENKLEQKKNEIEPDNEPAEIFETRFESIISFPYFLIHISKLVGFSNDIKLLDDKKLLDMYDRKHYKYPEIVQNFIFQLLKYRFLFDKFIVKRDSEKEKENGDWSLKKMNHKDKNFYYIGTFDKEKNEDGDINKKIRTLQSALRITYTSPKTMHWITEILGDENLLAENNGKSFLDKTEHYCKNRVKDALLEFDKTKDAYRNMERIVYTFLDYILWRDGYATADITPLSSWKFLFRNSLEHFYPQHPDKTEHQTLKEEVLHSFGNLCLVDANANAKFSNAVPIAKISNHPRIIEQSLKLKIMAKITKTNNGWNENTIKEHEDEMLKLLRTEIDKDKK
jgi:uncharacterized protein with ParB-like and HNH nuclease domain